MACLEMAASPRRARQDVYLYCGAVLSTAAAVYVARRVLRTYASADLPPPLDGDAERLLADPEGLRQRVVRGGCAPHRRRQVWPRLLGLGPPAELETLFQKLQVLRKSAASDGGAQHDVAEAFRVIAVDVPRTPCGVPRRLECLLQTYAVADAGVLYAQGMADIAAAFEAVFAGPDSDAVLYAAFAAFMRRQRRSFLKDISAGLLTRLALLGQLLRLCDAQVWEALKRLRATDCIWAMRPVAVCLYRELHPAEAATVTDVLISHPDDDYLLYIVAAALLTRRRQILAARAMDDLLLVSNSLAPGTLSVDDLLTMAAQLHRRALRAS